MSNAGQKLPKTPCPHCSRQIAESRLAQHVPACRSNPASGKKPRRTFAEAHAARRKSPEEKIRSRADQTNPAALRSTELKLALAKESEDVKSRALSPTYTPRANDSWKRQRDLWATTDDDTRRNYLYDLIISGCVVMGSKNALQTIARYFCIDSKELDPYLDVMWMADTARTFKVTATNFSFFMHSDRDAAGKFHNGKQFAYQTNDPAWEGVDAVQAAPPQIVITSAASNADDPKRKDLEEQLERRIASVTQLKVVPGKKDGE